MRNTLIVWGIVLLVIFGSVFAIYKVAKAPVENGGQSGVAPAVSDADQMRGPRDAKVVLVEYSDFQCPACASFSPIVEEINKELEGKILFVYREFPLPQHKSAELAAYAAEAAGKQGKFWEMHDELFKNQNVWSVSDKPKDLFDKYAELIGLNMDTFNKDIDSGDVKDKVARDKNGGFRAGVNSTPNFYLNGNKLPTFNSYDEFKQLIRDAVRDNP